MPRNATDNLPEGAIGQVVAIADRIDTLVGIFAIGQKPTGTKDPFALRRASLALLRIMIERGSISIWSNYFNRPLIIYKISSQKMPIHYYWII